ncbi:MAG: hypothetical protein WBM78_09955, partial [Desulfobacterales bacterium]
PLIRTPVRHFHAPWRPAARPCAFNMRVNVRIIVIGQHIPTPNTEYPTQHAKNKKGVTPSGVPPFFVPFLNITGRLRLCES